jgi:hypothetical protein
LLYGGGPWSMNGHAQERGFIAMEIVEILFNNTIEQCRELGARGGRIRARNLRLCKGRAQTQDQPAATVPPPPDETVHDASLQLDAQFPWLAGAFAARPNHGTR